MYVAKYVVSRTGRVVLEYWHDDGRLRATILLWLAFADIKEY